MKIQALGRMSDEELIKLWRKRGNREILGELFRRHRPMVERIVYRELSIRLGNNMTDEDVEDGVQETFYKAFKNIGSLRDPKKFKGWLKRIAQRTAIDIARKKWKEIGILEDESEKMKNIIGSIPDTDPTPEEIVIRKEELEILEKTKKELSNREQKFVELYLENKSYEEIAKELGYSSSQSACVTMRRIRKKLKKIANRILNEKGRDEND